MKLLILLFLCFQGIPSSSGKYLDYWTSSSNLRFDILQGYLKDVVEDIMFDESSVIKGGVVGIYFSFDCVDDSGNALGCGIYMDNQWGGNRNEQFVFIPLDYVVSGENHFLLSRKDDVPIVSNIDGAARWVSKSSGVSELLSELCNKSGWHISYNSRGYLGISQWIFTRGDSGESLYYNCL